MISIIFPKLFEMSMFILDLNRLDFLSAILNTDHKIKNSYVLRLNFEKAQNEVKSNPLPSGNVFVLCVALESSDTVFSTKFSNLLRVKAGAKSSHFFLKTDVMILCGTAGGESLSNSYLISEAYKYDRGSLQLQKAGGFEFASIRFRKDKIEETHVEVDLKNYRNVPKAIAVSGNYIMNAKPSSIAKYCLDNSTFERIKGKTIVGEMETCDFFMMCKENKIKKYFCVRVVSDVYTSENESLSKDEEEEADRRIRNLGFEGFTVSKTKRALRKLCDFSNAIIRIQEIIVREVHTAIKTLKHNTYDSRSANDPTYFERLINDDLRNIEKVTSNSFKIPKRDFSIDSLRENIEEYMISNKMMFKKKEKEEEEERRKPIKRQKS